MRTATCLLLSFLLFCCQQSGDTTENSRDQPIASDKRADALAKQRDRLVPFFNPMTIDAGDWLSQHPEDGETFEQYIASGPTLPTGERTTIYIQPVGKFSNKQAEVIRETAEYMKAFFNLPVTLLEARGLGNVPTGLSREVFPRNKQIRTAYFLNDLLPKLLPSDAAALICFTNYDLYPGDTWNYVFGQASLEKRVGVWSLWRLERDMGKLAARDLFLSRTLKVAMHETGHMFSMRHCTKYECLMSGTNHLGETDRRPVDTCPECSAKIAWAMNYPLAERYRRLAEFWKSAGNSGESERMLKKLEAVR